MHFCFKIQKNFKRIKQQKITNIKNPRSTFIFLYFQIFFALTVDFLNFIFFNFNLNLFYLKNAPQLNR